MLTSIHSMALVGVEGNLIDVEVDMSNRVALLGNCWLTRYKR